MIKIIEKIMCKLNRHKWDEEEWTISNFGVFRLTCKYCGVEVNETTD